MSPNRLVRYLLMALLVTSGILTREGGGVANAAPVSGVSQTETSDTPRLVAISPVGTINRRQTFQILINLGTGEAIAYGYQSYIHGLDENDLYSAKSRRLESTALFTFYIQANVVRVHRNGPLREYELLGHSQVFYDDTPDGDYSNPDTFRDGVLIATGDENVVFTFDQDALTGIGDVYLRQTGAWPFDFNGELVQFGEVGDHSVTWRAKTDKVKYLGWTRVFCTSTTVQGERIH